MTFRHIALVSFLCLLFTGCSSDIENEIVGEWKGTVVKQDLVFHEDGHIDMKGHEHSVYSGRYTIEDVDQLTCNFPKMSEPVKCTAKIRGEKLTLIHPGGREEIYTRK